MRLVRLVNELACSSRLVLQIDQALRMASPTQQRFNSTQSSIKSQAELTERLKKKKQLNKTPARFQQNDRSGAKKVKRDSKMMNENSVEIEQQIIRPSFASNARNEDRKNRNIVISGRPKDSEAEEKILKRLEKSYLKNVRSK